MAKSGWLKPVAGGALLLVLALGNGPAYAQQTVTVELTEFEIIPATITVRAGETVTFVGNNTGGANHDLRIEGSGVEFEIVPGAANIAPGASASGQVTFAQAGTYQMWCPVGQHRARGMEGTLTVLAAAQPAAPAPAAGPAPAPASAPAAAPARAGGPAVAMMAGLAAVAGAGLLGLGAALRRRR